MNASSHPAPETRPHRYSAVIAGGSGTRLWPFSRRARPKQLIPVAGGRSLLELAWHRVDGAIPETQRIVCATESFRAPICETLPTLTDENFLGEPLGRDTLAAVGLIAHVLAARDPRAVVAILTADHVIEPADIFRARLEDAFRVVESDRTKIATFGIAPTHAATGYGYIERGAAIAGANRAFTVARFHEKPNRARAEEYLAQGSFAWNSGMFVFAANTLREAIARLDPACAAGLSEIAAAYDTPARDDTLARVYPTLPKRSIDVAVMEPEAARGTVCMLPLEGLVWLDVGSWTSFAETVAADDAGNRSNAHWCDLDSRGMTVISDDPSHLIATVGCNNLVIVHTKDATLVCPPSDVERVKALADRVPEEWR
ncbi:MAG: mannose-1-phosphate guanylyltransferase [Limnohabitans sp.]|jgi:mannose-1-phosphate guanylyltransferase|nr:mannose-1-phosphate guanylyltransferase [Limnohabitans sp.]